jgi:hypothetical protein
MGVTPGLMGLPTIGFPCSTLPYQTKVEMLFTARARRIRKNLSGVYTVYVGKIKA